MKLPSIIKIARPQRFSIKPRHYDPIKEDIEQRTANIKKQMEAEGLIQSDREINDTLRSEYRSSIKGAFTQRSEWKKDSPLILEKTGLIRLIILVLLLGGMGGYLYLGSDILYYLLYLAMAVGLVVVFFRLRRRFKNE
ncbi:MAG: hypothetical protein WD426_17200 [Anditalea sp.]